MDSTHTAGLLVIYAIVELVKWLWKQNKEASIDRLKDIKVDQKETTSMIRDIAAHQEITSRLLSQIVEEIKNIECKRF